MSDENLNPNQNTEQIQNISEAYQGQSNTNISSSFISTKQWLVIILIASIPVLGFIFLLIWTFGDESNMTKKNWARAQLIYMLIWVVLTIPFWIFMFFTVNSFFPLLYN